MTHLSIRTLGPLQILLDDEPVTGFDSDKVRGLLAYLIIEADRPHRREKLAGLLWPDFPERSARTSLRSALANLRKVIGDQAGESNYFLVTRQTIQFNRVSNYDLDVHKFNTLIGTDPEGTTDAGVIQEAISLYSGDFLEGFSIPDSSIFEEWILVTREALRRDVLQAYQRLTLYYQELERYDTALEFALRQVEMEPFQEAAHQQAMWIWALSGRRNEALAHYERFRNNLESELGVAPLKQTQEMYQQLVEGDIPNPPSEVYILRREPRLVGECPYRGLAAFREEDAHFYYGREGFIQQLVEALKQRSLVGVILGSSGSGKSSAVHAGLFPRLREGEDWLIIDFRPAGHPFQSIAKALSKALEPGLSEADRLIEANKLADSLITGDLPLINIAERILEKHTNTSRLLLLVDQFEELYTLYQDPELRYQFIDMLLEATRGAASLVLLMTLRADFMGQVLCHRPMADALQDGTFIMGPMNREELRAAIQVPGENQGADFEPGLVNRILDDVGVEPGNLPLLEFALTLMWEQLDQGWLTHAAYEKIGRVEGALTGYAEKVYSELSESERENARRIFVQLVQPGEGTGDTRRIATRQDLGDDDWFLIQELADRRLVVTGIDEGGGETAELVHEAMISGWNRIRDWMDADRSFRIWQEGLRVSIRAWQNSDRDEGALLRGAPLAQAEAWLEERYMDLSQVEIDYIQTSVDLHHATWKRREKRRRRTIIALVSGLVLTIILLLLAFGQWRRAENERVIAFSRELAAAAHSNLNIDPELSILLALSAVTEPISTGLQVPREAEEVLHTALLESRLSWSLPGGFGADFSPDGRLLAASGPDSSAIIWDFYNRRKIHFLSGHSGDTYGVSVDFSPDGERLVTASADGTAKVWEVSTGREILTLNGHTGILVDSEFNQDGSLLGTISYDDTVRIWDSETGEELLLIEQPAAAFIDFDPGGDQLAIAVADADSGKGWVEIRDVENGKLIQTLTGHEGEVNDVAFSMDGKQIATASNDGTVRIWDALKGQEKMRLGGQEAALISLDISSDGRFIAAGGFDGRAKIWDIESGDIYLTLLGHSNSIYAVDFSPDGKFLASASLDGTTKVWDISPGGNREWLTLAGHNHVVFSVDYSPDGNQIATSSWDGTAAVWDASTGAKLLTLDDFDAEVARITYSPEGAKLATVDYEGMLKVWDATTGNLIYAIPAHSPGDIDVAFSPAGRYLATGGSDGIVKLWDSATGEEIFSLTGHTDVVPRIAFNQDGTLLASASWDDTTRIWDVSSGEQILELSSYTRDVDVNSVDFSPDGNFLATTHKDGIARVWDITAAEKGERLVLELVGHSNIVWDAVFSKDGKQIATLSFDGTARLWDAETGEEILVLPGNNNGPDLEFSPDGKFLATTSGDGSARVYVLSIEDLIALAGERVSRSLNQEECQKYLHLGQCPENDEPFR